MLTDYLQRKEQPPSAQLHAKRARLLKRISNLTSASGSSEVVQEQGRSRNGVVEAALHLHLMKPVSLKEWQEFMHRTDSETTFHDHRTIFQGPEPCTIVAELKQVLDDFGTQGLSAVFAVRGDEVFGLWLDNFHNYLAFVFSKAKGDEDDAVLIQSLANRD